MGVSDGIIEIWVHCGVVTENIGVLWWSHREHGCIMMEFIENMCVL